MSAAPARHGLLRQPWSAGLRYGALGLPLAFAALPLHLALPAHYAGELGVPLASLGGLLLLTRAADALIDPWLGRQVDRWLAGTRRQLAGLAGLAALLLVAGFQSLFFPPASVQGAALLGWCGLMLMACSLGCTTLGVLHQAWGARLGGDATQRTRLVAWREGAALVGVLLASVLPSMAGLQATSAALAATLAVGLAALALAPRPPRPVRQTTAPTPPDLPMVQSAASTSRWAALHHAPLRRLLLVFGLNGLASAVPATLVLFFIRDRLQAPQAAPLFLGLYFTSAALSLPLWVRAVRRWGLVRSWAGGMGLAMAGFVATAGLQAGDLAGFGAICLLTGLALGADLSVPPALLAGLLQQADPQQRRDGEWFGWWQLVAKLTLALAAGLSLPLLQQLGYQPGLTEPTGTTALAWTYGALPCALKAMAALLLWHFWLRQPALTT